MDLGGKGSLDKVNKEVLELKSGLQADCILGTFWQKGRDGLGAGLQSSPSFAPWSSRIHPEKEGPPSDLHKMPLGPGRALLERVWSLGSICEDALEFKRGPEGDGELWKNLKGRPETKLRSVFEKVHSGCILKDGKPGGKGTSERGPVQVRNNGGLH